MARTELDVLLDKVDDIALRAELKSHIERINSKRTFGLVFESHLPERVRLPEHPIRRGVKVTRRDVADGSTFEVLGVAGETATIRQVRKPDGISLSPDEARGVVDETAAIQLLVVIADFGEPVYPGLRHLGSISRGGDKPAHVVNKGENHHVLEMLQFTHAGKVDCIYIDPPYNSGARDWKYDNNYVDSEDAYRHSKWLAFMERRLRLAKQLLNPEDSVLIVTIDEKEVHRLGLLLQQIFPSHRAQMVSIVINPLGQARKQELGRVEEYAFCVFVGAAQPARVADDLLSDLGRKKRGAVRWEWLLRGGTNSARSDRPNLFYPVFIDPCAEPSQVLVQRCHSTSIGTPCPGRRARSLSGPSGRTEMKGTGGARLNT